jgi:hypothetical protein
LTAAESDVAPNEPTTPTSGELGNEALGGRVAKDTEKERKNWQPSSKQRASSSSSSSSSSPPPIRLPSASTLTPKRASPN